jgi:hypothetical protein
MEKSSNFLIAFCSGYELPIMFLERNNDFKYPLKFFMSSRIHVIHFLREKLKIHLYIVTNGPYEVKEFEV